MILGGIEVEINNKIIHYPDFHFQKFCEKKYGVNRGVYNTIDNWLFEKGIVSILKRRKEVLSFLNFANNKTQSKCSNHLKFGNGGLTVHLNEFYSKKKERILK